MATYTATIHWARQPGAAFTDLRYSRAHTWAFDGGVTLPASSSPHHVRLPYSDAAAVDPEEAYVAALASCHMLGFLYSAARRKFAVTSYRDAPIAVMGKDAEGRESITQLTLAPHVVFEPGERVPTEADIQALHHEAHEACYLANSVKTVIEVKGSWEVAAGEEPTAAVG